ncbi:hypothetical protein ACFZAT_01535 [Streptomyces sp. NPDC008163]|uniref:hypothetical protein n=1 Tax=Streptomyces sp. NPDC008163 TaxID=3364818 RepID=UPI0036EA2D91
MRAPLPAAEAGGTVRSRTPVTPDFFGGPARARIAHFGHTRADTAYAAELAAPVRPVAGGRLHPEIRSVRDWSRTGDAIADIRARRVRGNAALTVG